MSRVPQGTLIALKILYCWSQSSINLGQFIQKILELAELHDLNASDIVANEEQPSTLTFYRMEVLTEIVASCNRPT